jgi:hypothetical protein
MIAEVAETSTEVAGRHTETVNGLVSMVGPARVELMAT